jgi:hypothetical protein
VPQAAGDTELPRVRCLPPVLHLDAQFHRRRCRRLRLQDPAPHADHVELIDERIDRTRLYIFQFPGAS